MEKYHKIQTVYLRDPETNYKTLMEGVWANPEFELLKDIKWVCTEKIDGTNIRILWDGKQVEYRGKTDKAQIPTFLFSVLQSIFTNEIMKECFPDEDNVCLYGEGYGARIQKGGNYLPDTVNFILFDIKINKWWLQIDSVADIAYRLNIMVVPAIGIWKLEEAVEYVKNAFISTIAYNKEYLAEGLIMKPIVDLFNRNGNRIITKIKYKDFNNS